MAMVRKGWHDSGFGPTYTQVQRILRTCRPPLSAYTLRRPGRTSGGQAPENHIVNSDIPHPQAPKTDRVSKIQTEFRMRMASSSPKVYRFLTSAQVQRLYVTSIANATPSQPGLLESAVASPINVGLYTQQDNLFQLAANLSEKIMKTHAFQDGNKRAALVAADMFLKINGFKLQPTPMANDTVNQGLADAHVAVVTNQWSAETLGNYYESIATPLGDISEEILQYRNAATEY